MLAFDRYTFPKGDVIFDLFRRVFRFRVVPRRVRIGLVVDQEMVITRHTFPWAGRVGCADLKVLALDRRWGKVHITFDNFEVIAFRDQRAVPQGFRHGLVTPRL